MVWAWLALVLAGCRGGAAVPASGEIVGGVEITGDPAVVALTHADDARSLRCTGVLVGERVVLTAAHCGVHDDPSAFAVTIGAELGRAERRIAILDGVAHPDDEASSVDHDLAVLLLAEAPGIAPLPLDEVVPRLGPARLVGFGQTASSLADADRRREGTAEITSVEGSHVVLGGSPSLPCLGDSGGPVFVDTPGGERLAAIVSRGDSSCSDRARATRLDVHLDDFLRPRLAAWAPGSRSAGERCLDDELCASGLCVAALDDPSLRFCGAPCDTECDAPLSCQDGLCRPPTPSPGALGAPCAVQDDCERGDCLDERAICSVRCVDTCPGGLECAHLGGIDFYCVPPPAPQCAATHARSRGTPLAILGALAAWAVRRRGHRCSKSRS